MINDSLIYILKCYLHEDKLKPINYNSNELLTLASSLNVSTIVAYVLNSNGYNDALFEKCLYKAIGKYTKQNEIYEKINSSFNDIEYLFVKGRTIAKYYKEEYLRYCADIDVVVKSKDYDRAYNILTNDLSFNLKKSAIHEVTLVNKDSVNIDFHRNFLFNVPEYEKIFEEADICKHEFDDNYKYIYHLAHGAIHFARGQLDLRFFIDLFYLRSNIKNINIVDSKLKKLNLTLFNEALNSYLDAILGNKEFNELDIKINDYIFAYAKDLGAKNRVRNNSNKISYFIKHAFPSFSIMKGKYSKLNDYPILLPYYYLKRILILIGNDRGSYVINELKEGFASNKSYNLMKELNILGYNK